MRSPFVTILYSTAPLAIRVIFPSSRFRSVICTGDTCLRFIALFFGVVVLEFNSCPPHPPHPPRPSHPMTAPLLLTRRRGPGGLLEDDGGCREQVQGYVCGTVDSGSCSGQRFDRHGGGAPSGLGQDKVRRGGGAGWGRGGGGGTHIFHALAVNTLGHASPG